MSATVTVKIIYSNGFSKQLTAHNQPYLIQTY